MKINFVDISENFETYSIYLFFSPQFSPMIVE